MNIKLAKQIGASPTGKEFIEFIKSEIRLLNRVDDIKFASPEEVALETKGRQKAIETLTEILTPLITAKEYDIMPKEDEYVM